MREVWQMVKEKTLEELNAVNSSKDMVKFILSVSSAGMFALEKMEKDRENSS